MVSDERRWIDQAIALKSELPAQVTISWEAYFRRVKERDEAREKLRSAVQALKDILNPIDILRREAEPRQELDGITACR